MKIGIPQEIMTGEGRIALTPEACRTLVDAGHELYVQRDAGEVSAYSDAEFHSHGAVVVDSAQRLYQSATLIVKVKQPLEQDLRYLDKQHILFSYLHLAADVSLIHALCDIGLCVIPFEAIRGADGSLPLLAPMSQVAGRIAMIRGASLLFKNRGGRGVLLGGVEGADIGRVVVLGAGVAGGQAVGIAAAFGARVDVLDLDEKKLQALKQQFPTIEIHLSTPAQVENLCVQADLVVGAVLLAGRRAPVVLKQSVVRKMNPGSVIVDIAIDQGGCVEGIHATSSEELCYIDNGIIHSAVPNMPATVARTSSQSLSSAVLPYVLELAGLTLDELKPGDKDRVSNLQHALSDAMAICRGEVVDPVLRQEIQSLRAPSGDADSLA